MATQIKTLTELCKLASKEGGCEIYIQLNNGLKSSKNLSFNGVYWFVENYVDGSSQQLTTSEFPSASNIMEALAKGALYLDK